MIKVLLCCEGNLDKGKGVLINDNYVNTEGVIQVLINRFSPVEDLKYVIKNRGDIKKVPVFGSKHSKHSTISRKLAELARGQGCRCIAYHQDEDNKGFANIYNKIQSYFSAANEKSISCIAIVPKHMTESWLLSDAKAYEQAFGKKPENPGLPSKPELTWGNKWTEKHPKKYISRVLSQYNEKVTPENYTKIAVNSDVNVIRSRCPKSFGQFYSDMQSFIPKDSTP